MQNLLPTAAEREVSRALGSFRVSQCFPRVVLRFFTRSDMSTPTRPVNIRPGTPQSQNVDDSSISGSPDIRALRAQYGTPPIPNIPPRNIPANTSSVNIGTHGTGSYRPSAAGTPIIGGIRMQAPGGPGSGTRTPASGYENPFEELTDEEKARILRRHLVSREQREQQLDRKSSVGSFNDRGEGPSKSKRQPFNAARDPVITREDSEPFPIPYHTPGADLTHNIYKWEADQRRGARPRAASFAGSTRSSVNPVFANIHEPGGFRRNYLLMRAHEQGEDQPEMVSSFIEFLYLFGHFVSIIILIFWVLSNAQLPRLAKIWRKSKRRTKRLSFRMKKRVCKGPLLRRSPPFRRLFALGLIWPNHTMKQLL